MSTTHQIYYRKKHAQTAAIKQNLSVWAWMILNKEGEQAYRFYIMAPTVMFDCILDDRPELWPDQYLAFPRFTS